MLPYENTTSGDKAISQIQKMLRNLGCSKFGTMTDDDDNSVIVQFKYRGSMVSVKASAQGYAKAWLKEHPWSYRVKCTKQEHEKKALAKGEIAVYSILRDWIKGQIMAIETGVLSFEGAFLGQLMLPNGKTVLEHVADESLIKIGNES